ncbi:hypothetical protein SKAU_G00073770 [Synaphobranchus kaupii]|uniref:RBR-type E3 ubiquitin transferase n=1 Tax=Synaphobranchus kaupii TaxID=118154 RepID=A0A9Q1G8C7_SYNKA|nr:hypothetical protein SKAU_G00073770 [Synaphobranchus kaupii]
MSEDQEVQEDELLALASIYDLGEFQRDGSARGGEVRICPDLPRDFKVNVKAGGKYTDYGVSFLPPLVQNFELPPDYPSTSSPLFTLNCKWLSEDQPFDCGICFSQKLGSDCFRFRECEHVYCVVCTCEYFKLLIREGAVQGLKCPQSQCSSEATPTQVKQVVGEELFSRYDRLLLQSSLDNMADITYCPRYMCATAVLVEPDNSSAICSSWRERLPLTSQTRPTLQFLKKKKDGGCNRVQCTKCQHYFCWVCLSILHQNSSYRHFNDPASLCPQSNYRQ